MQTRERAHFARSVFPFIKKKKKKRLEGSPEKGLVQGCSREGEERPNPELLTLEWVAVESWPRKLRVVQAK